MRSEYAQAAFRAAVPGLADAMIARGLGTGRDAQRAGERILETVGVLPKGDEVPAAPPIQVVTHTYVLVQREDQASKIPPQHVEVKEIST